MELALLGIGVSLAALIVSILSYRQAIRAVTAAEQSATMAEARVRPILKFGHASAKCTKQKAIIGLNIENIGSLPATITYARVETIDQKGRTTLGHDFDVIGALLYPGETRKIEVITDRKFTVKTANFSVDYFNVNPDTFQFTLKYRVPNNPNMTYTESVSFPELAWAS